MEHWTVRDLMVPLEEYAVVGPDASLLDLVLALERAQRAVPPGVSRTVRCCSSAPGARSWGIWTPRSPEGGEWVGLGLPFVPIMTLLAGAYF